MTAEVYARGATGLRLSHGLALTGRLAYGFKAAT
jgi:hypothetical protein